jgi:hypothetical protein
MTKDEALKLALEALEAVGAEFVCRATHHHKKDQHGGLDDCPNQARHEKAITAIKQALAAQPAPVQPVAKDSRECPYCYHNGSVHCGDVKDKILTNGGNLGYCSNAQIYGRRTPPAQPALVEPDWKAEYLKSVESGCITLDELREARAELDATNRQVEILSDALAESQREVDAMVALARADERERIKEENQRCYAVKGTAK